MPDDIPYLQLMTHAMCMQVDNGTQSETASIYNLTSNTYQPFHITEEAEAGGHVLLPDGRGIIIGGLHCPLPCYIPYFPAHLCVCMSGIQDG